MDINQFSQSVIKGMLDLRFNNGTISCQIDQSEAGELVAGQAVKVVDSAGGVPKVVACSADSDEVYGFLNYDQKSKKFVKGDAVEISQNANVMYLQATEAIARGAQVCLDVSVAGGVSGLEDGSTVVGWAFDKAVQSGDLFRVHLQVPTFNAYSES